MSAGTLSDAERKKVWHQYYSRKRIVHQWTQVDLLSDLSVQKVLEIGPYLGLVTAMLRNAGYDVTTLDVDDRYADKALSESIEQIRGDVRNLPALGLSDRAFDAVLCCETLEHLPYDQIPETLSQLAAIKARYLILSVPFMGNQLAFELYANAHTISKYTGLKKFMGCKQFPKPKNTEEWEPHKWEIGYRDYPLKHFRELVSQEFDILKTEFTAACRSVFLVAENKHAISP